MRNKTTKLARRMGVKTTKQLRPLTPRARRALNVVLRDLDEDERETLVLMNASGPFDWNMVDGIGRVWHFTENSTRCSWNMLPDTHLDRIVARAR